MAEQPKPPGKPELSLPGLPGGASISWLPAGAAPAVPDPRAAAQRHAQQGDWLWGQGRLAEAVRSYCEASRLQPDLADYHWKAALAAWQISAADLVEFHFRQILRLTPGNPKAHEALSQWHFESGNLPSASAHSARALELAPTDPDIAVSRAIVLEGSGEPQAAWKVIEPLLASGMLSPRLALIYGRVAPKARREREALAFIGRVLGSPSLPAAHRAPLHFTAASLLDRLGQYDQAFRQAQLANEASRRPYDPAQHTRWIDRQISYFTSAKLNALPHAKHGSRRPVFVIGMMRSGTSLVEQILASHPDVHGAGELSTLGRAATLAAQAPWATNRPYPDFLDGMSPADAEKLASAYLSEISSLNATAKYVTDKLPHNFLYLGLISLLFPDCHVIHCVRDPRDICLSCYMTHFANSHEFTHELAHLAAFYRDYRRLMRHWQALPKPPMLEVCYEELVNDLPAQTRRMLQFLELPWDDRCLRFHENKRLVATASHEQVRRPVYASSVGRWKHYEKHLSELITAIGRVVTP